MSGKKTNSQKILQEALKLPRQLRAMLAEKLLQSLDYDDDFELSAEWIAEAQRRCKELEDGDAAIVPAEDVFKEAIDSLEQI